MKNLKLQAIDWDQIQRFQASAVKKLTSANEILAFDEEACLQLAYESMLKSALGFMFSHGFRPGSQPGHHMVIIEFGQTHLDKKHTGLFLILDRLRRKRNTALYDDSGFVSRLEAEQALKAARDFLHVIDADIQARKP